MPACLYASLARSGAHWVLIIESPIYRPFLASGGRVYKGWTIKGCIRIAGVYMLC